MGKEMNIQLLCEKDTQCLGEALSEVLKPGDAVLLRGKMGAGKSVLARACIRGLGVQGPIPSPTFTILNIYEGRLPVYHFDLYRISDADEFYGSGLDEYLPSEDGVSLVEWPEQCEEAMPPDGLEIQLRYGENQEERIAALRSFGRFEQARADRLYDLYQQLKEGRRT